jgi:aarF domain-containing kinase
MLRSGVARQIASRTALGIGAAAGAGGVAATTYAFSEQGLGLRREVQFWHVVSPVVFDYWWNASSSSPYVKYQKLGRESVDDKQEKENEKKARQELLRELHERNAPRIFQVLLDLGGLYIKLGQVLSVTALPIPEDYRDLFRTLQSNVPGHEEFEIVVKPILEKAFGKPLDEIFESVDEIPCGAASIGQAHRATLKETGEEVIVKVQYPNAKWQVPADIQCVGDFLRICVWFGLVDESNSRMSYDEFSRQFLAELDYEKESENLQQVYESSLDPLAPYIKRGVVIPRVFPELCTKQVVTMTFLPGPKFEEEARRQLALLGIDTKKNIRNIVGDAAKHPTDTIETEGTPMATKTFNAKSWQLTLSRIIGSWVGVDSVFSIIRFARRAILWSTAAAVASVRVASTLSLVPTDWESWAKAHENAALQAARLDWTQEAVHALLDVHGYQILNQGLFNADPHPGNILVVQEDGKSTSTEPKIGLIDYGQCKKLTPNERVKIARLIVSVADDEPDEAVATHFRSLGIQTKNDSTEFLAKFARLMFGSFKPEHMDHSWHESLHKEDKVIYFPNELSMVYRTSLLLRGLAMSLQLNVSVGEQWRHHAQAAIDSSSSQS